MNTDEVVEKEEQEEEQKVEKPISEMTDDEIGALSSEDAVRLGEAEEKPAEEERKSETSPEDEEGKEQKEGEPEKKDDEDEFTKSEEYKNFDKNAKGLYHQMKDERTKRQAIETQNRERELELERLKAANSIQQKLIDGRGKGDDEKPKSEYERVKQEIMVKARSYKEETGDEYRLSIDEYDALDVAKQADATRERQSYDEQKRQSDYNAEVISVQKKIDSAEDALQKTEEYKDYGFVYKTFVDPLLNPDKNQNKHQAVALAQGIVNAVRMGQDPAKYAYDYIATLTDEGRKYFKDKMLKATNKELLKDEKKITKTTAHQAGVKTSDGRTKVTPMMIDKDESWYNKLNDDQLVKLGLGEDVFL